MNNNQVALPVASFNIKTGTHENMKSLQTAVEESGNKIIHWAAGTLDMVELSNSEQTFELAVFTVEKLGFSNGAMLSEIYDAGKDLGYDLCLAEAAIQFLIQHGSKFRGSCGLLIFTMKPIRFYFDGSLILFRVYDYDSGLALDVNDGEPSKRWPLDSSFVFMRLK